MIEHRITIVNIRKPVKQGLNEELQWLGRSLGLFGERDKDKSCFRIFIQLIKTRKSNQGISSDELAELLHLSRGTVVHHINHLMKMGLVETRARRYFLRSENLEHLIHEIRQDAEDALEKMKKAAEDLDKMLRL